jgi:hypothetical protein
MPIYFNASEQWHFGESLQNTSKQCPFTREHLAFWWVFAKTPARYAHLLFTNVLGGRLLVFQIDNNNSNNNNNDDQASTTRSDIDISYDGYTSMYGEAFFTGRPIDCNFFHFFISFSPLREIQLVAVVYVGSLACQCFPHTAIYAHCVHVDDLCYT